MSQAKASKRTRRSKTVPALGVAGLSLSVAGGASAATPAADLPTQKTALNHEITLGEEELSDVSLGTFYVFDKENIGTPRVGDKLAWYGRCGGCRCGGCRCGWRACGGCGGCGGCCLSWGYCRYC